MVAALARVPASAANRAVEVGIFSSSWKDRLDPPADLGRIDAIDRRIPGIGSPTSRGIALPGRRSSA